MVVPTRAWVSLLLALIPTSSSVALASNQYTSNGILGRIRHGGAQAMKVDPSTGSVEDGTVTSTKLYSTSQIGQANSAVLEGDIDSKRPLRVLFLSADTGGGHRASAEALAKQFLIQFPGSEYALADLWTDHGCFPYRSLVGSYKTMSANPWQWRIFYHLSNTRLNEVSSNFHSYITCGRKIKNRIQSFSPDVIVSVHPTMNHVPLIKTQQISKELGKHIPFFTVVTDLGSAHCMWFEKNVNKLYVASDRLFKIARKRGGTAEEDIVMTGLPIRHGFAVEAEKLGDRTTEEGKLYQKIIRKELGLKPDKPMILVMGGGEGVGSLSDIVDQLYAKLRQQGVDATVCVVCGRNEKLKGEFASRNWDAVLQQGERKPRKRRRLLNFLRRVRRSKKIEESVKRAEEKEGKHEAPAKGNVDVVGLGFIENMPEYMVAADILVTKAGPGTIAEAASVGLPLMLTSFLPGQEAGNVDVVLESGYGDYCENPSEIAQEVGFWLQDSELLKTMSLAAQKAGHPYAADEIVHDIGTQTVAWMNLNEK